METLGTHQCRLCMCYDSFQLSIFQDDLHNKQILMKLQTCLPVKVEHGDGLPSSICYRCLSQLEQSYELWNKSFNSEAILKHNLARGRNPAILKTSSAAGSTVSDANYKPYDNETHFFEPSENVSSDPPGSDDIFSELGRQKENLSLMWDKPSNSAHFENPKRKCIRVASLSKDYPSSSNTTNSENATEKLKNNCDMKTYPAKKYPKSRDNELEAEKKLQKGKNEYFRGAGTLWMDNEELSNDESNTRNKYIDKNIFGNDVLEMYSNLRRSLRNTKKTPDSCSIGGEKCNAGGKNKTHFSREKKKHQEQGDSSETECNVDTYEKSKKTTPKSKETLNIDGLQFDPNHCPKCNTTLTPSQNLLAHFQSHREDD